MTLSPGLSLCLAARHPGGAPAPPGVSFQVPGSSTWAGFGLSPPGLRSLQVAQGCLAACFGGFSHAVGHEARKCKVLGCSASSAQHGLNFHLRNPAGVSRSLVSTVRQRRRYLEVNQGRNELRVPPGQEQPSCGTGRGDARRVPGQSGAHRFSSSQQKVQAGCLHRFFLCMQKRPVS